MYINDIKPFVKKWKRIGDPDKAIRIYCQYTWMEFGIEK